MQKTKRFDLKTVLTVVLAVVMALSLAVLTACGDKTDSSSSSSSSAATTPTPTDMQTITNGDFEFSTKDVEAADFPVSTGFNWTRSNASLNTSAHPSSFTSGIIDTADGVYEKTATTDGKGFPVLSGENDETSYFNPRTPYYYGYVKDSYVYDEETANEDKLPTVGTKILMIHNATSEDGRGTAQKFTSTTNVSVPANSYAKLSLWVMTYKLNTLQNTDKIGAYVSIANTVGSEKAPFVVENINTDGKWAKITVVIEGNALRASSYRITLGLGTGSHKAMSGYVEGYAYFDNVTAETLTKEEFLSASAGVPAENEYALYKEIEATPGLFEDADEAALKADLYGAEYAANGEHKEEYDAAAAYTEITYSLSYKIPSSALTESAYDAAQTPTPNDVFTQALPAGTVGAGAFSTVSGELDGVVNPVGDDAETIYMIFKKGQASSYTLNSRAFTLADGQYTVIGFYAKVKALNSQTAATVKLIDLGTAETVTDAESVITSNFNTNSVDDEENHDWVKFCIAVKNDVGDGLERSFKLTFDFGPTEFVTDSFAFPEGYALFTGFEQTLLSDEQFSQVSVGDYGASTALGADLPNGGKDEESENDSYNFTYAAADKTRIENSLTKSVINYTGVVANHTMVGGDENAYSQAATVSGIFNTKYVDNYSELTEQEKTNLKALEKDDKNKYLQALLIKNTSAASFGYLGASAKFTAGTTTMVSVKLKVYGNATANVYLANANALEGFGVLGIAANRYTYENNAVTIHDELMFSYDYRQSVTAADCVNGWMTVNFVITAGMNDINYRVEVWNGTRDGSANSEGLIVVDSVKTSSPDLDTLITELKADYGDTDETTTAVSYARIPSLVKYTDDDGKDATTYREYQPTTVYTVYNKAKTVVASHATIDVEHELDERTSPDDTTTDSSASSGSAASAPGSHSWALQISSIIIAVAIILVLIVIAIRFIVKRNEDKTAHVVAKYDRGSRDAAHEKIRENKASDEDKTE